MFECFCQDRQKKIVSYRIVTSWTDVSSCEHKWCLDVAWNDESKLHEIPLVAPCKHTFNHSQKCLMGQNIMWTTRGTARSHVYRTGFAKNQHEYCKLWAETQALCLSRPSQWLTIIKSSEKRLYILFYTFFYIDVTGTSHATATSCDSQVACVPYGIC